MCVSGRALSGDSLRHHDVLLGWNSPLHHVPGDDQQDNRQVGDGKVSSSHSELIYLALHRQNAIAKSIAPYPAEQTMTSKSVEAARAVFKSVCSVTALSGLFFTFDFL